jgi:hypothetical protein
MMLNSQFHWWHITPHGTAELVRDTPEVSRAIDAGAPGYFATIEGAILHGGVRATAFARKTEDTYDARAWLETGAMVPAGQITTTTITAQPEG